MCAMGKTVRVFLKGGKNRIMVKNVAICYNDLMRYLIIANAQGVFAGSQALCFWPSPDL